MRAQGVWALGNLPCAPTATASTHTQAQEEQAPGLRLSCCVEEGVLVSMARAALAALAPAPPHTAPPTQRVKASAVRAVGYALDTAHSPTAGMRESLRGVWS